VAWLTAGQVHEAVVVLELLLGAMPNDEAILYNLGMAHSDLGDLTRAEDLLRQCLAINPDHTNARVALGVALLRQGRIDDAAPVLERAVADAPDNSWAHRNLAGVRQREGRLETAIEHLRSAVALNPRDERSWAGLGQALEETGETTEADEAYKRAIELAGFGDIADAAQKARSRIAQARFRANSAGIARMDAVMYCLAALQRFAGMAPTEVQQVVAEIATIGTQGLDVNNPERTHPVRSLNDRFTGLQLVSYLYVGMQQLSPAADVGFDLSREYAMAQDLLVRQEHTDNGSD